MDILDLFAQEQGFKDFGSMREQWKAKDESLAKAVEGMVIAHVQCALQAVQKYIELTKNNPGENKQPIIVESPEKLGQGFFSGQDKK